ncbi:MAG TPA: double zinc ribbon domain-containing protein, partial [Thermoanaerobaculia bacterium]|nr:double zinc ribbon domain-containing protein [Thermoanaerobaculia bacterium]
ASANRVVFMAGNIPPIITMSAVETRLGSALSYIGREALRIVLPAWCVVCRGELPWRDRVASSCGSCWRSLPSIGEAKCRSCAIPLSGGSLCIPCSADPVPVEWCEAWGEYRAGLERLLHAFKFERHEFLDAPLAGLLEEVLRRRGDLAFDAIVPVPMHRAKHRRRGYNQAELLAAALARRLRIRSEPRLLTKTLEKQTQSSLSRAARADNVRGVFSAAPAVRDRAVLLVDDICTTGETFRSCATELLAAGAARVCAVAVAKAV